ncbi:MAG: ABC transporter substrate-binding protein [Peptococcaceae bacterium]
MLTDELSSKKIQRIVSLVPSVTEILYFLGLEDRIAGVTENCNYPKEAAGKFKVGTFGYPQLEKIISLKPDIVLGDKALHGRFQAELEKQDIIFLDTTTAKVEDIFRLMEELGKITGTATKSHTSLTLLQERLAKVRSAADRRKPRVFYLMSTEPFVTPGPRSCQYDALKLAGARLLDFQTPDSYAKVGWQQIKKFDPEVILFCGVAKGQVPPLKCKGCLAKKPICRRTADDIRTGQWQELNAVRKGRLYPISCATICRPGPRLIEGVEKLHNLLTNVPLTATE